MRGVSEFLQPSLIVALVSAQCGASQDPVGKRAWSPACQKGFVLECDGFTEQPCSLFQVTKNFLFMHF